MEIWNKSVLFCKFLLRKPFHVSYMQKNTISMTGKASTKYQMTFAAEAMVIFHDQQLNE
jgi:hypothetical protein